MEKFVKHTGSALPLRRSNVDTDQIIPAVYLSELRKMALRMGYLLPGAVIQLLS